MEQIADIEGVISTNRSVAAGYRLLTIRLSRPMAPAKPGQFVMIRIPSSDVFLRRPFSIYDYKKGLLSILFRVVGTGTTALAEAKAREKVVVLGPLGNGFAVLPDHSSVLVAGGIGVAGIHLLWSQLRFKGSLYWGCASNAETALLDGVISCEPFVSTMDGSYGCKGNVVELLAQHISRMDGPIQVFACGPEPMFLSLRDLLNNIEPRIPCQVLLEERMACGLGICFGCVRQTLDEAEPYKRVCKEGPVFDLWQISL